MITPVWALTIDKLCERKDDLLVSADDIKELARNERAKAINEFAERLKADTMAKTFGLRICDIDRIAEEMRGVE